MRGMKQLCLFLSSSHGLLALLCLLGRAAAFYVPGVAPVEFTRGQKIDVKAVKMTSSKTQLPYEYYSLPLCLPKNGTVIYKSENLGEVLRGDRIVNTPYEIHMDQNVECKLACNKVDSPMNWSPEASATVVERIQHEYSIHLIVDNLPAVTKTVDMESSEVELEHGYRLGYVEKKDVFINNHLKFILMYHKPVPERYRVVGFEVEAKSIALADACAVGATSLERQKVNKGGQTQLLFTYSVEWRESPVSWASRWDSYLGMSYVEIHWFSIINSLAIIFFLSSILALIMVRTLRRDIARYNADLESMDDVAEETGWKLVHGDVFRAPRNPRLFAALVGSGVQVFFMALITIFFAMLGMLSPSSRGGLMTAAIFLYVFMGLIAGYFGGRLYKTIKGREWRRAALLTATLYPGVVFGTCFLLNFFIWGKRSSGAVPFSTMLALLCLWFGISVPLVYLGYFFGYRKQPWQLPVRTNQIPRQVPPQKWYLQPLPGAMLAGVLPFGAVSLELFFIFTAIWQNRFYYLFGFLFLVFCILVVSCGQIAIVMVYFQLRGEDYRWWWRSLVASGGSSIYVLLYALFYFFAILEITEFIPTLLYLAYTGLMVFTFWLLTGTIGFFAAFVFLRKIYGAVKFD